ncbi:MAG: YdcF family protein [Hyphomonadaceae bacterium]
MDFFFTLSKLGGLFLAPSNLVGALFLGGLVLWRIERFRAWGRRLTVWAASAFLLIAFLPIGDGALAVLERRFPRLEECPALRATPPGGVILLGGGVNPHPQGTGVVDDLNDAADRVRETARLARQFPAIPVLVSGGQAFENGAHRSEAAAMADLLVELGVARDRIILESSSRTTAENAALTAKEIKDAPFLLVTSAFHMPRAVGTFRKAGVRVLPAPTDWRVPETWSPLQFNAANNLGKWDLAVREYLGLAGYWIGGRSDSLFPGPDQPC